MESVKFYEIEISNKVVKGNGTRIKGRQGDGYDELLYFLAESEDQARKMAQKQVSNRHILGIPKSTRRPGINRVVKILNVRRIAG